MKAFILLILGALIFGGGLGGSFIIGQIVGKNQSEEALVVQPSPTSSSSAEGAATSFIPDATNIEELRQRFRSGDLTQEEVIAARQRIQSQLAEAGEFGQFQGRGGLGNDRPSLTGTITAIHDNVLTLTTNQGVLEISVGEDITIRQTIEVGMQELTNGIRLSVVGEMGDDGHFNARMIQIIPEGVDFPSGEGLRRPAGAVVR